MMASALLTLADAPVRAATLPMKKVTPPRLFAAVSAAVFLLLGPALKGALLSAAYEAQLETWLGQGDLDFTSVFIKTDGATSLDFHAAADGKGATFTLMNISGT